MILEDRPKTTDELREVYRIYRRYIEHEDELTNNRAARFIAFQTFLFTAYGLVVSNTIDAGFKSDVISRLNEFTIDFPKSPFENAING